MPVPSQGHYGFHSFPVVDWFCLFIYLWVLTFTLQDCLEFGNFVITLIKCSAVKTIQDLIITADIFNGCDVEFWARMIHGLFEYFMSQLLGVMNFSFTTKTVILGNPNVNYSKNAKFYPWVHVAITASVV